MHRLVKHGKVVVAEVAPAATVGTSGHRTLTLLAAALLAVACLALAIGAVPRRVIPWRNVAQTFEARRVELVLAGVGFLVVALAAVLLTETL